MCTQKPPHDYSEALYNRYRDVFCYYINDSVRAAIKKLWASACFTNGVIGKCAQGSSFS